MLFASQSSIRPGDDSDLEPPTGGGQHREERRNPVFALEMIQTATSLVQKIGRGFPVAIQYSPWR